MTLRWIPIGHDRYESTPKNNGYRITGILRHGAAAAVYHAWSPIDKTWRQRLRAVYAIGDSIPMPRLWLGERKTLAMAKELCEQHSRSCT